MNIPPPQKDPLLRSNEMILASVNRSLHEEAIAQPCSLDFGWRSATHIILVCDSPIMWVPHSSPSSASLSRLETRVERGHTHPYHKAHLSLYCSSSPAAV
jgi:hypothetical protein